jgi:iron only hydrogenase large subunit-like protein
MSAILSKEDLNDFISPGVACIKPVEVPKSNDSGRAEIEIGIDGVPVEVLQNGKSKQALESAQISLTDCLACSGCITSAETVLVSMQSHKEVLSAIRDNNKTFVASISHQVRVSLAAAYGISVDQVDAKLKNLLVSKLGFRYVVGLEVGRAISLEYVAEEALRTGRQKPVLSSSCPGWTCYVEKTHPEVIPFLSKVKSPQQITGTLIKTLIHRNTGASHNQIYHLSIMPCFDKKLEAARPEFGGGGGDAEQEEEEEEYDSYRDVDCVITAKEVVQMLLEEDMPFENLPDTFDMTDRQLAPEGWPVEEQWISHEGTSSGGYLDHVLRAMQARERIKGNDTQIEVFVGKNSDTVEYHVVGVDGEVVGKVAQIYGFRNIQNLVRKLKPKRGGGGVVSRRTTTNVRNNDPSNWDYVEVMACPGGCINGGGQIGAPEGVNLKQWKDKLEEIYNGMEKHDVSKERVASWIDRMWNNAAMDRLVLASYHVVVDVETIPAISIGTKW